MSLCGGGGERGECPSPRGRGREPWARPTCSPGAQRDLHLSFTLAPAHYGLRGTCVELCTACESVSLAQIPLPVRGGKRACAQVGSPPPPAGRCAPAGARNLGHQHLPPCTWARKSFASESACDVCVQMCVAARDCMYLGHTYVNRGVYTEVHVTCVGVCKCV